MSRPREAHVPTKAGTCEAHGPIELRGHKNGTRVKWVCPACHTERVRAHNAGRG